MAEFSIKHDRTWVPSRLTSFYEVYKRFLKEHGCKWHDVAKFLTVVAEILFDVDGACSKIVGKVSFYLSPKREGIDKLNNIIITTFKLARGVSFVFIAMTLGLNIHSNSKEQKRFI